MGTPSTVLGLGLLLTLAVQWLLVTANPTGAPSATTTGLAADATSTASGGTPHTADRTAFPVTDSGVSEQDSVTVNLDTPTTNSHAHSAGGGTSLTDTPAATRKEKDIAVVNPTTVTTDQDGATAGTTTTADPHLLTTAWDSLTTGTGGVVAVRDGGSDRPSTLDTIPPTTTVGPVTVTTSATTNSVTHAAQPTKRRAEPACPAGCECESLEVHCSRAGLVTFPHGLDAKTTYLDVGHNRLTAIADDELADLGLTQLTSLICDDNIIESVGQYAFRGLRDLSLVQLSGNRIRHLSPFVFVGNNDLRHVDLTGNPLQLGYGPILSVHQLEWLDLDQCNITELPTDAFRDMRGLRYLNLNGNRISSLSPSVFRGLHYLRYIKLNGNPLLCNCAMKPIWLWFQRQTIHVDAKCIAPLNGSTQSWNFLELLRCEAPLPDEVYRF